METDQLDTETPVDFTSGHETAKPSLDALSRRVARFLRPASLTPDQFRYVMKRVRGRLGLKAAPAPAGRLPEVLTAGEADAVLSAAYREHGERGLMLRVLFETGCRVAEFVSLQADDFDPAERTVRVRNGKGGRDRVVLVTPDLGQQLSLYLAGRRQGPVFRSPRGGGYSVRRVQQIVSGLARVAGVRKRVHPHTFRHSMATRLRNAGASMDVVQALLGHSDPRSTRIYARLALGTVREEFDRAMAGGR